MRRVQVLESVVAKEKPLQHLSSENQEYGYVPNTIT